VTTLVSDPAVESGPAATSPAPRWRRHRGAVAAILALFAIATGVGLEVTQGGQNTSAKDRIEAHPPPTLFTDAAIAPTGTAVDAVRRRANDLFAGWVAAHGSEKDDTAFATWVADNFPAPPANLADEMAVVDILAAQRTRPGVAAATWLETYGKKDVWKLYAHDQGERLGANRRADVKNEEKAALKLAKKLADALGAHFASSAPYVRKPSLRPDHHVTAGQQCPCSYPSRHAAAAAASETLLGHLNPSMDAEYRHLEAEIDYSRIYMAGHFPSDVTAGALLGDVVGDYLLVTREHVDPADL
jgi:membrane-associated phospholipid phosphatase